MKSNETRLLISAIRSRMRKETTFYNKSAALSHEKKLSSVTNHPLTSSRLICSVALDPLGSDVSPSQQLMETESASDSHSRCLATGLPLSGIPACSPRVWKQVQILHGPSGEPPSNQICDPGRTGDPPPSPHPTPACSDPVQNSRRDNGRIKLVTHGVWACVSFVRSEGSCSSRRWWAERAWSWTRRWPAPSPRGGASSWRSYSTAGGWRSPGGRGRGFSRAGRPSGSSSAAEKIHQQQTEPEEGTLHGFPVKACFPLRLTDTSQISSNTTKVLLEHQERVLVSFLWKK